MPTVDALMSSVDSVANWTASSGDLVADVQAVASGAFIYSFDGFNCSIQYRFNLVAVPSGATINSIALVADVAGIFGHPTPYIDGLGLLSPAGNYNTGVEFVAGSFSELIATYPNPITRTQLTASLLELGTSGPAGTILCDYLAVRVDYTDTSPQVMTWASPPWPTGCGVPPLKRFKPFQLFAADELSPVDVTAAYARKFGPPPVGSTLWLVCRALDSLDAPNENSPLRSFVVPP